jgi:hypothetical protein
MKRRTNARHTPSSKDHYALKIIKVPLFDPLLQL